MTERTIDWQLVELEKPVHPKFIKKDKMVKGEFTSGDYVRWQLNRIFGADNWSLTILDGPKIVEVNTSNAYAQATCRLTAQFANGQQVMHDDVGVWPLSAGKDKDGKDKSIEDSAPERFETVTKACVTDALKACAEQLGLCFRPLSDQTLIAHLATGKKQGNEPQQEIDPIAVRKEIEEKIAELFPNDVATATMWLVKRYTGHATPKNIRYRIDNLTASEQQEIVDALTEKADIYKKAFAEYQAKAIVKTEKGESGK